MFYIVGVFEAPLPTEELRKGPSGIGLIQKEFLINFSECNYYKGYIFRILH